MTRQGENPLAVRDLVFLYEASRTLLGNFVDRWFRHYLGIVAENLVELHKGGIIAGLDRPTELGRHALFDFRALDLEKLAYICGIYTYVLSCHKSANRRLMNRNEGRQVLYLRGFDYEGTIAQGGAGATFASTHTSAFTLKLAGLMMPHVALFKVLSPRDVYWETVDAQRHFHGDYDGMIRLVRRRPFSVYLNAGHWKEGVAQLFDRMDHFVVYVSSITESVLWELAELDTDARRGRVTVVFDEEAIANKESQLGLQESMRNRFGLAWAKKGKPPAETVEQLRERLAARFLLTTPEEFETGIEAHRARIAASAAPLAPGTRETWLDFRFAPALDAERLAELQEFSEALQARIAADVAERAIACLPLFLNQVQLRIYMTLLFGRHDETGRALAVYAAVMRGALDYYTAPGEKIGDLSPAGRERHLAMLREHLDLARYTGITLLAYGESHRFESIIEAARAEHKAIFDEALAAVARFFALMGGPLPNTIGH